MKADLTNYGIRSRFMLSEYPDAGAPESEPFRGLWDLLLLQPRSVTFIQELGRQRGSFLLD